ncbi:uncharacterized protein LOC130642881 isoform X1 [Hydractinia symbiolongicarpus]|uniref:uncharacterized protein LOC130642881 isoform X1 n=1 Tax=Hydractinia symbiolongicarpus TaxID=13093 RepID=UPI00254E51CF|nr:uncharacterized protein LOC130642881 isoform X1 [Hydractinia symbiolongicarpus]
MAPKQQQKTTKRKQNTSSVNAITVNEFLQSPHLFSLEQWVQLGKETLLLLASSRDLPVQGKSVRELAISIMESANKDHAHPVNTEEKEPAVVSNDFVDFNAPKNNAIPEEVISSNEEEKRGTWTVTPIKNYQNEGPNASSFVESSPAIGVVGKKKRKLSSLKLRRRKISNSNFNPKAFADEMKSYLKNELATFAKTQQFTSANAVNKQISSPLSPPSLPPIVSSFPAPGSLEPTSTNDGVLVAGMSNIAPACESAPPVSFASSASLAPSASSLPAIPKRVLEKIRTGEYVNFDLLLPPGLNSSSSALSSLAMDDVGEFDLRIREMDGRPTVSLNQKSFNKSKVKDFHSWCLAWSNYFMCMLHYFPHLTSQLLGYQQMVVNFANQYEFSAVYIYDQLHRLQIANDPTRKWDKFDELLFNNHIRGAGTRLAPASTSPASRFGSHCFTCRKEGHFASNCPSGSRQTGDTRFRNASRSWGNGQRAGWCYRYNNGLPCREDTCHFVHRCTLCDRMHPSSRCSLRPSAPSPK